MSEESTTRMQATNNASNKQPNKGQGHESGDAAQTGLRRPRRPSGLTAADAHEAERSLWRMRAAAGGLIAAGLGASAAGLSMLFRRRMLAQHGVATSLYKYVRLRFHLRSGWDRVMVLADFDRTLTTASCGTSCHGVVESCTQLSASYRSKTKALFDKYFPLETSATLSREEKIPIMTEWYQQAHTLLLAEPFTPQLLESAARTSKAALRPGCDELFAMTRQHAAPLVVCSAGLGNVVQALLVHLLPESESASLASLPVVSNWLRFDDRGVVSGFSEPLLHMFNKDGQFIRTQLGAQRWEKLANGRSVCLLLGDGLGDATMADGLGIDVVLKIGFLNETEPSRVAERLPAFEAAFDAVILGDRSMDWVLELLRDL